MAEKPKKRAMIIEILREQIANSGKSKYRISRDTGIDQAVICRIMQGKSCTLETADVLCEYFGIEMVCQTKENTLSEPQNKTDLLESIADFVEFG